MKFSKLALALAASLISVAAFADAPADLAVATMTEVVATDMAIDLAADTLGGAYVLQSADAAGSTALIVQDNSGGANWAYINQQGAGAAMINQAGAGNFAMILQK